MFEKDVVVNVFEGKFVGMGTVKENFTTAPLVKTSKGVRKMKIEIEIPKEFEEHFDKDRFEDSLERIYADLELYTISDVTLSGRYELEVIKMLKDSLIKAEVIKE